jgi:hypothetical protein
VESATEHFDGKDDDRCPRELFNLHLADAIRTWLAEGDQLVVAMDAIEDVRSGTVFQFLLDLILTEAIIDQHGPDGPSTFAHGQALSMVFLCPLRYSASAVGILATGMVTGASGWISPKPLLSVTICPIVRASVRRLKVEDPRVTFRYTTELKAYLNKHDLLSRSQALQQQITSPLSAEHAAEWEYLDSMCTSGILNAKRNCRKLPMGTISWSPQYKLIREKFTLGIYFEKGPKAERQILAC